MCSVVGLSRKSDNFELLFGKDEKEGNVGSALCPLRVGLYVYNSNKQQTSIINGRRLSYDDLKTNV